MSNGRARFRGITQYDWQRPSFGRASSIGPSPEAKVTKLVGYSVTGGTLDKAVVTKTSSYSITGGTVDKAVATKTLGYGITGGTVDKVVLTKLNAYAIIDDNLYRPQIFVIT